MAISDITIDPVRTAIAIGYQQPNLIADQVLPRVPVEGAIYAYEKFSLEQSFDVVDDFVGREGKVRQARFASEVAHGHVKDYGLDFPIPNADLRGKPPVPAMDRRTLAMKQNLARLLRNREKRVADLVFGAATYPTAQKATLSGDDQWSSDASTPLTAIRAAADSMVVWPNTLVVNSQTLFRLQRHPEIVAAVWNAQTANGFVGIDALKELLQVERILVGKGFFNASKGKSFVKTPFWGNSAALLYVGDKLNGGDATFGFTAQFGTRYAGELQDPDVGLRGGVRFRVGESVDEHITCPALGYLFQDVLA